MFSSPAFSANSKRVQAGSTAIRQVGNPMPLTFWKSLFECEASLGARFFDCREDLRLLILGAGLIWGRLAGGAGSLCGGVLNGPERGGAWHKGREASPQKTAV